MSLDLIGPRLDQLLWSGASKDGKEELIVLDFSSMAFQDGLNTPICQASSQNLSNSRAASQTSEKSAISMTLKLNFPLIQGIVKNIFQGKNPFSLSKEQMDTIFTLW